MPNLLVYAGPNGSGKSTITTQFRAIGQYVNADEIKKKLNCSDIEAAQIADSTREYLLNNSKDFTFETVLSTHSKIDFLIKAKKNGYFITCIYVLTNNPQINIERVRHRVSKGGHSVPVEKIVNRYIRALKLIPNLISICDELYIYDNSSNHSEFIYNRIVSSNNSLYLSPNNNWSLDMLNQLISGEYPDKFAN